MAYGKNKKAEEAPQREPNPPALIAWHVVERGEQKFWTRIGAAWEHKDGDGLGLHLDLFPTAGGRIVLRAPKEKDEEGATPADEAPIDHMA
jgi:hypothetical protein